MTKIPFSLNGQTIRTIQASSSFSTSTHHHPPPPPSTITQIPIFFLTKIQEYINILGKKTTGERLERDRERERESSGER
ncbi:hypothetical protein Hanom_Chr03g00256441 [Helianthus anomalus]